MFRFYWPWFAFLLPVPIIVRVLFSSTRRESIETSPELRFPSLHRLKEAFPIYQSSKHSTTRSSTLILSLIWILLTLTLMQPERVDQYTQINNKGYDLLLAVDISQSMQALDFSTSFQRISRLDVVKDVVSHFVISRQGDRVGLITFGQNAYLTVPLTLDTLSVSNMLNSTVAGMAGNSTAIGDAIGLSVRNLRERPKGSRVLILLTDGEDNASSIPPLEAAKLAKQYGIRIYSVGVGKNGPVPFPNQFGGHSMVEMSIDEDLLTEIAEMTGGHYFRATDQEALKAIYDKINLLEKTESNVKQYLIRDPLYHYPLCLAMLLILFLVVTPIYRRATVGS